MQRLGYIRTSTGNQLIDRQVLALQEACDEIFIEEGTSAVKKYRPVYDIHPHQSHLCAGCGQNFRDNEIAIGNPAISLRGIAGAKEPISKPAQKSLKINQENFPGGIQLWGSNPPILWTSKNHQETGIHVHAYEDSLNDPVIDDTFVNVEIDGELLDEQLVRFYMAQKTLPHLNGRIQLVECATCGSEQADLGEFSFTPSTSTM